MQKPISIPIKPEWQDDCEQIALFISEIGREEDEKVLDERLEKNLKTTEVKFLLSLLNDLSALGWKWTMSGKKKIEGFFEADQNGDEAKYGDPAITRKRSVKLRNQMLLKKPNKDFIESMEKGKFFEQHWVSIFSLMRDGKELATKLTSIKSKEAKDRSKDLEKIISPYLCFVEKGERCSFTGLPLLDIWRYFRFTWSTTYTDAPVRQIKILVRDSAAPFHPVIGLLELRSSVAQQTLRDERIGWRPENVIDRLIKIGTKKDSKWLVSLLNDRIGEIFKDDFIKEGLISGLDIKYPRKSVVELLKSDSIQAREEHESISDMPAQEDYLANALMPLFRSKRAKELSRLLEIREVFQSSQFEDFTKKQYRRLNEMIIVKKAITDLVSSISSRNVGIQMMDLTTCGAIAPYNHLLGGKLVSMLATSPEMIDYYNTKYSNQVSNIASKMAGRAVIREPQLCLLNTTSLYARNSSQYNRLSIKIDKSEIRFERLGRTQGMGTNHLSKKTSDLAYRHLNNWKEEDVGDEERQNARPKLFMGEGTSPLLRAIRTAVQGLGISSDIATQHRNARILYTVFLAHNTTEVLLGISQKAKYKISLKNPKKGTKKIIKHWRIRWFNDRAIKEGKIERLKEESLAYPITHSARVPLYKLLEKSNLEFEF